MSEARATGGFGGWWQLMALPESAQSVHFLALGPEGAEAPGKVVPAQWTPSFNKTHIYRQ